MTIDLLPAPAPRSAAEQRSVARDPDFRLLLLMTGLGFAGFGILLPTAPLWAAHGGASEAGVGLVNAVLMLVTVLTQMAVPRLLQHVGWRPILLAGTGLLGAPALLHPLSDDLTTVLALSGVRGLGFGILTVCGAAAVARLAAPAQRGRAVGAYGLAIAAPQVALVPLSPWVAAHAGFAPVLLAAACPLLAALPAARLGRTLDRQPVAEALASTEAAGRAISSRLLGAILVLTAITIAGGALITFTPQLGVDPTTALISLLSLTGAAAVSRWGFGAPADRFGPAPFVTPLLVLAAVSLGVIAWAISDPQAPAAVVVPLAMALLGVSYGGLQNVTLVAAFAAVPAHRSNVASAAWNIGFDTGTGIGSLAVGLLAAGGSFGPSIALTGVLCLLAAPIALSAPAAHQKSLSSLPSIDRRLAREHSSQ